MTYIHKKHNYETAGRPLLMAPSYPVGDMGLHSFDNIRPNIYNQRVDGNRAKKSEKLTDGLKSITTSISQKKLQMLKD